jgi:hypothetical protein
MSVRQIPRMAAAASAQLAVLTAVVVFLVGGGLAAAVVALFGAVSAAAAQVLLPREVDATPATPTAPAGDAGASPERASLVRTCIYLRDRVTSTALANRLDDALAEVGVSLVDPTGERFDPTHHEAGGALATADDALVGTIAAVEAPGYADRGVLLRPPVVTVYQRRTSS